MNERAKISKLVTRLRRFNEWRRGADFDMPNPTEIGKDIDMAADVLELMVDLIANKKNESE